MEENKEAQENLQEKREQALWRLHEERTEEALWDCVVAFQEFEFHTYSGLPYSYHMKYGRSGTYTKELWIDRREKSKSLVWSSVRAAYHKVLELQEESARPVVDRPKDLGDIRGITYIYGTFLRVRAAGNAGEGKRETRHADGGTKNAGKIKFQPKQDLTTTKWVV